MLLRINRVFKTSPTSISREAAAGGSKQTPGITPPSQTNASPSDTDESAATARKFMRKEIAAMTGTQRIQCQHCRNLAMSGKSVDWVMIGPSNAS